MPDSEQINSAKGRLKTILHRELYNPIEALLESNCECKANTLFAYEKALYNTRAWPLEKAFLRESVNGLLRRLESFAWTTAAGDLARDVSATKSTVSVTNCTSCQQDFARVVREAVKTTREYFDGLCLGNACAFPSATLDLTASTDCMSMSNPKFGDSDSDYWHHNMPRFAWDSNCSITHGQPTWYFSFMGRKEKMKAWRERKSSII